MKLIFLILLLISCGNDSRDNPQKSDISLNEKLEMRINSIKEWLPVCKYPQDFIGISKDTCISEGTGTGDGDTIAYAGYLCLVGYSLACEQVRRSCESSGRCWRSPGRINVDTEDSFSRDMTLGVLYFIAATKDTEFAQKFLSYIKQNNGLVCPDDSDGRCIITPSLWGLFGEVWKYIDLQPTINMQIGMNVDDRTLRESAASVDIGYQLELVAAQVYLRQYIGSYTDDLAKAANTLVVRQPENPFFELIKNNVSDRVIELILNQAPLHKPSRRDTWSIARDTDKREFETSMGWEFIFLDLAIKSPVTLHLN